MTSGSTVKRAFSDRVAILERESRSSAERIHSLESDLQGNITKQATLWSQLASIHINSDIGIPEGIRKDMVRRNAKIDAARQEVEDIKATLSDLKNQRSEIDAAVANAAKAYDDVAAGIQARFNSDEAVAALVRKLAVIDQQRSQLNEKLSRADAEMTAKRKAYEEDPLFRYLRDRKFGSDGYLTWFPVFKTLDRMLADKTNFLEENANYERLLAIPTWIKERIAAVDTEQATATQSIEKLRTEYFSAASAEQNALEAEKGRAAEIRRKIDNANDRIAKANRVISDAALADDADMRKIVSDFAGMLKKKGFYDLKQLAASTKDTTDDAIIQQLQALNDELSSIQKKIDNSKSTLLVIEQRTEELRKVNSWMGRNEMNSISSSFPSIRNPDELVDLIVNGYNTASHVQSMLSLAHRLAVTETYSSPRSHHHDSVWGGSSSSRRSSDDSRRSSSSSDSWLSSSSSDSWLSSSSSDSSSSDSFSTSSSSGGSDSFSTSDSF